MRKKKINIKINRKNKKKENKSENQLFTYILIYTYNIQKKIIISLYIHELESFASLIGNRILTGVAIILIKVVTRSQQILRSDQ